MKTKHGIERLRDLELMFRDEVEISPYSNLDKTWLYVLRSRYHTEYGYSRDDLNDHQMEECDEFMDYMEQYL